MSTTPRRAPRHDTFASGGRHPVNVGHLVMGLAFLGIVGIWALVQRRRRRRRSDGCCRCHGCWSPAATRSPGAATRRGHRRSPAHGTRRRRTPTEREGGEPSPCPPRPTTGPGRDHVRSGWPSVIDPAAARPVARRPRAGAALVAAASSRPSRLARRPRSPWSTIDPALADTAACAEAYPPARVRRQLRARRRPARRRRADRRLRGRAPTLAPTSTTS